MRRPPAAFLTPWTCDAALAGEEVAELPRHQRRQPAAEVDVEPEPVVGGAQRDHALRDARAAGVEAEGDVHLVEGARPLQAEVDRRRALDPEEGGDHAALRLLQRHVEVELAGGVREGGLEVERPARRVQAVDVERGVERAAGEIERTRDLELGGLPEHRLPEGDARQGDLLHVDRHRQLGQGEGLRLGARQLARRLRRRIGPAQPGDPLGGQPVDVDPPAQERQPAPVDLGVVDPQPDALVVGDGDPADPRPRGEGAGDAAEPDLPAGGGEPVLQQVYQEAVVAPGFLGGVLGDRGDRHERQKRQDGDRCRQPFQNACPMPM